MLKALLILTVLFFNSSCGRKTKFAGVGTDKGEEKEAVEEATSSLKEVPKGAYTIINYSEDYSYKAYHYPPRDITLPTQALDKNLASKELLFELRPGECFIYTDEDELGEKLKAVALIPFNSEGKRVSGSRKKDLSQYDHTFLAPTQSRAFFGAEKASLKVTENDRRPTKCLVPNPKPEEPEDTRPEFFFSTIINKSEKYTLRAYDYSTYTYGRLPLVFSPRIELKNKELLFELRPGECHIVDSKKKYHRVTVVVYTERNVYLSSSKPKMLNFTKFEHNFVKTPEGKSPQVIKNDKIPETCSTSAVHKKE